jgi:rod shape-determining protein MreD
VRIVSVVAVMIAAVALQMAFARFTVGGRWSLDLVLVAVAFVALKWGPSAGVIGGTIGGLTQDALAGGTIGVGGLSKTIVGFGVGVIGSQFVVARSAPRVLVVVGATVVDRMLLWGITNAIDLGGRGISWVSVLTEVGLNALVTLIVFQSIEIMPGMMRRRSSRRSAFGARKW